MSTDLDILGEAAIEIGADFGVGGSSWTVARSTGSGIGAARTWASVGTVTGYVIRPKLDERAPALPGTPVAGAPWVFVADDVTADVQATDILVSVADSTIARRVIGPTATDTGVLLVGLDVAESPL